MKRTAWVAVIAIIVGAAVALIAIERRAISHSSMPVAERLEYYKLYVNLATAVLVGFGATLLGILIPAIFAEARFSFERLKDSRTAYSEAKTGVDYLPLRISTLDVKGAAAHVQRIHVKKHEAELYPELRVHLLRRGITKSPDQWGDDLYDQLSIVREILESHASEWDALSVDRRLALIRERIKAPRNDTAGTVTATSVR